MRLCKAMQAKLIKGQLVYWASSHRESQHMPWLKTFLLEDLMWKARVTLKTAQYMVSQLRKYRRNLFFIICLVYTDFQSFSQEKIDTERKGFSELFLCKPYYCGNMLSCGICIRSKVCESSFFLRSQWTIVRIYSCKWFPKWGPVGSMW